MNVIIDKQLEKKLADNKSIQKHYGKLADKLIIRISLLQLADTLNDIPNVPPTRRHKLSGNYKDCWGIDIDKSWRLIIASNDEQVDPKFIKNIRIIDVVDYH